MSAELLHRRMPRKRKVTLGVILSMAFTNSVLLVVTLVRPVPQFSSSGTLMSITANENATLGELDLLDTKMRISRGRMVKRGDEEEYLRDVEEGDKEEGSWYIGDEGDQEAKSEQKETSKAEEPPTAEGEGDETTEDSESEGSFLIYSTASPKESDDKLSEPHHTKAAAETDEDEYWVPGLNPDAIYSNGNEDDVKYSSTIVTPTATVQITEEVIASQQATETVVHRVRSPNVYIEAWIGPLGVCIQRGNGTIACSGASITANFRPVYEHAGLNDEIRSRLPSGLNGLPVAILLAAMVYIICTAIFAFTLSPPFNLSTPYGPQKSMDVRHQTALAINTVLSSIALFLVLIPTFTLRSRFLKVVDSIPAWNSDLTAKMGGAFAQLYATAVLGGLILLQSMVLVSEDLRHPWWYLYNNFWRNPFQTTSPGIDFTAHRQLRDQLEAQAEAERARLEALADSAAASNMYGSENDEYSSYAPTGVHPSVAPSHRSMAYNHQDPPRPPASHAYSSVSRSRRYTGSAAPSAIRIPSRPYAGSVALSQIARNRAASAI